MQFQRALAQHVREKGWWREGKAEEHPDDARNARSAAALSALADELEALPDDDPALLALDSMQEAFADDVVRLSDEGQRLVSRYGFDGERLDVRAFLEALAAAEARDREDGATGDV